MKVGIVGGGWAGMAAAVAALRQGHAVTVFEAARTWGGRARGLQATLPDGRRVGIDNGQHILIGAYRDSLALMQEVGVDMARALLRMPLRLSFPDGAGVQCPDWPAPLDAAVGIWTAGHWGVSDKLALSLRSLRWRLQGMRCTPQATVAQLCAGLPQRVMDDLIEPLCVSALNTPSDAASGEVFLRVLRDSVFGRTGDAHLLLPQVDLSALFPAAAAQWAEARGAQLRPGARVEALDGADATGWRIDQEPFDHVVLATPAPETARLLRSVRHWPTPEAALAAQRWCACADALRHNPITTVYAWAADARLQAPLLALRSSVDPQAGRPAQFVFDRGQLGGPAGLLAFVVSNSAGSRDALQDAVLSQARSQLGIALAPVQTVVEKRATFVCSPGLLRPPATITATLRTCGDHVAGPYPATLEGAVRSGLAALA
jgi:squalene-associated FAD-dependent desaturase